jgi:hypothetical protein
MMMDLAPEPDIVIRVAKSGADLVYSVTDVITDLRIDY